MFSKINRKVAAVGLGLGLAIGGGSAAVAAVASGPALTSPAGTVGPYYSGPVHVCVNETNEGVAYYELHSTEMGNCANGYRQIVVNELAPQFVLEIGTTVAATSTTPATTTYQSYNCVTEASQASTPVTCTPVVPPAS
jgi:hypothetical protein